MSQEQRSNASEPAPAGANGLLLKELVSLAQASQEISAELSLDRLLQRIADVARTIVGCRYAALGVIGDQRRITTLVTSGIDDASRERISGLPQGSGLLGLILDADEPVIVDDLSQHPESADFLTEHPAMKTFLGVPIRYGRNTLGNLYLAEKDGGQRFSQTDAQIVTMFAAQAGIALENARLFAEADRQNREAVQERLSLEAILNSMAEGIYTLDRSWRITRVNAHAAAMVNLEPHKLVGRRCWEVFRYLTQSGKVLCDTACPARQAIASEKPGYVMEATLEAGDREIPVAILAAAIRNEAGEAMGVVETVRDISQRKEVDELRDSIVSLVSHELRTPLSHIKGFASSLLQPDVEWDEETKTDFIRSIDREADRLGRLVSDLLDMSRLESGRTVMSRESIEPAYLVQNAIERTSSFLRDHVVEMDVSTDLPRVAVDAAHTERVLENLLENAAKYSHSESQITVSAQVDGAYMRIGVHDRGVGVPEEERERVFEKFVRLEQDRAFRLPGTGLGLSICKTIVEAHGGSIWVEDNDGGGAVFYFTLPLALGRQERPTSREE